MERNIYLVGFMGTGKTTVGKLLSGKLEKEFVEIDDLIEGRQGLSIEEIFCKKGEDYFRKIEKDTLKEVAKLNNLVVSCGGGIIIDKDNIAVIKNTGIMVCLTAEPHIIYERTKRFSHRPLLNVVDPQSKIKELLNARDPFYRQAHLFVDTSQMTTKEVVSKIIEGLKDG